jgi:hypothetical protein
MSPLPLVFVSRDDVWKMSSDKHETRFVKRVNTRKGCCYHSQHNHDPSLTLSKQMKYQDVNPPPLFLFPVMMLEDVQ